MIPRDPDPPASGPRGLTRKAFLERLAALAAASVAAPSCRPADAEPLGPTAPLAEPPRLPLRLELRGTLAPGVDWLRGVAFGPHDRLYVAGAEGIRIFDAEGRALRTLATSGPVVAVAVDPAGRVYAALRTRIETFDPEGRPERAWGGRGDEPGQVRFLTGIAADGRFVWAADSGRRCIHRYAADGDFIDHIGGYLIPAGNPACAPPEPIDPPAGRARPFVIPSGYFDLAIDGEGRLVVGHTGVHRVEYYDANGRLVRWWGRRGGAPGDFGGCCNPTNLALFADGRVVTAEKGPPKLKVFDAQGTLLAMLDERQFPGQAAGLDVAVDSRGRIAMVEPVSGAVRFYTVEEARG